MAINSLPETVWLSYSETVEVVAEKSQSIFQRVPSDEEYARMIGARTGETVRVYPDNIERSPGVFIPVIYIHHSRIIQVNREYGDVNVVYSIEKNDRPQLIFQNCTVPPMAQRKGLATRMLSEQVSAARAFGYDQIIDYADNRDGRNGHYTWPRLGFDKCLTSEDKSGFSAQFKQVTFLSELIEQPEGLEWWRKYGFPLELTFDTSLQSRSIQLLDKAIARANQKGGYWDSGPEVPLRIERGEAGRPHRDWVQRIWEYRLRLPEP